MSAEQLFAQMDANKDGKIEQAEAKGPLAENFAKIDTNKDGTLSLEEIKNGKPSGGRPGGRPGGGE